LLVGFGIPVSARLGSTRVRVWPCGRVSAQLNRDARWSARLRSKAPWGGVTSAVVAGCGAPVVRSTRRGGPSKGTDGAATRLIVVRARVRTRTRTGGVIEGGRVFLAPTTAAVRGGSGAAEARSWGLRFRSGSARLDSRSRMAVRPSIGAAEPRRTLEHGIPFDSAVGRGHVSGGGRGVGHPWCEVQGGAGRARERTGRRLASSSFGLVGAWTGGVIVAAGFLFPPTTAAVRGGSGAAKACSWGLRFRFGSARLDSRSRMAVRPSIGAAEPRRTLERGIPFESAVGRGHVSGGGRGVGHPWCEAQGGAGRARNPTGRRRAALALARVHLLQVTEGSTPARGWARR